MGARRRVLEGSQLYLDQALAERGRRDEDPAANCDALGDLVDPAIKRAAGRAEKPVVLADSRTAEGTRAAFGGDLPRRCLFDEDRIPESNPNTSQALVNADRHAMQWLKTASIDDIIKSLPPAYYKSDEKLYRHGKSLEEKPFRAPMGRLHHRRKPPGNVLEVPLRFWNRLCGRPKSTSA